MPDPCSLRSFYLSAVFLRPRWQLINFWAPEKFMTGAAKFKIKALFYSERKIKCLILVGDIAVPAQKIFEGVIHFCPNLIDDYPEHDLVVSHKDADM